MRSRIFNRKTVNKNPLPAKICGEGFVVFTKLKVYAEIAHHDLSREGFGLVGGEEEQNIGDVLGLTGLQRQVAVLIHGAHHVHIQLSGIESHRHGRNDVSGADRVAADIFIGQKHGGVLGDADDGRFGRDVNVNGYVSKEKNETRKEK